MSRIREEYVSTGKVRFVYKNFAILGQESSRAAEGSECAAEQDLFWEYHDYVFNDQATINSSLNDDNLIAMAGDMGMDVDAFAECLYSNRYAGQVQQAAMSIQSLGVRGTPGFVVNGVYISGAQPFEVFQQIIEEQLVALGDTGSSLPAGSQPVGPQPAGPQPPNP